MEYNLHNLQELKQEFQKEKMVQRKAQITRHMTQQISSAGRNKPKFFVKPKTKKQFLKMAVELDQKTKAVNIDTTMRTKASA